MLERFVRDENSRPGSGTELSNKPSAEIFYVDIVPSDLVGIVVEVLRRDQLSLYQTALVLDAAAESALRQERGSNSTCH
jgi:hypothetical protein